MAARDHCCVCGNKGTIYFESYSRGYCNGCARKRMINLCRDHRSHPALDVNFALFYAACAGAGLVLLGMVAALLGG